MTTFEIITTAVGIVFMVTFCFVIALEVMRARPKNSAAHQPPNIFDAARAASKQSGVVPGTTLPISWIKQGSPYWDQPDVIEFNKQNGFR